MNTHEDKCIPYPTGCIVQNISPIGDVSKRYSLEVSINTSNAKSTATVIMMNPSKATKICSDDTVNKVLRFFKKYKNIPIKKVTILNLFPYYETYSAELAKYVDKNESNDLQDNIDNFENYIDESDLIVLAWGDVPSGFSAKTHNKYVKKTMDIITAVQKRDVVYVFKDNRFDKDLIITHKKRPRHPNRITLNGLYKIQSYSFDRGLLKIKL
ncbi:DUF1643 domain-containing protein [Bacillus thuringiensis]|uniref:DUF1643 domain-containing protein n=1 Tax=Bacillus thuringiensis TaxID=1428 RepID=UPI000BED7240|nr:DUF1643 domain-containing protein [Bacillus thuringiensis]PDX92533.1 hypothetical protein COM78_23140 [Bacillus thuringiensis]PER55250.1 hypothetical protein CN486_17630 [Bacillus thuringiensis]PES49918.1 hypothetical protein CN499_13660 [Bacillus thuringiensis]PEV65586.1 hypothetical protein CN434_22290 [Bacillus thuringiensis]PFB90073.1 hypothetical protein CN302_31840 [Bacillus thuringiensis]